jgi:hypothetical protein
MDLKELVARWLKDEFPNWGISKDVITAKNESWYYITFRPLKRMQLRLFEDRVEFDDDKPGSRLTIRAHDKRFFELLWNRLYIMESGFQRAMASRDQNRPEAK